MTSVQLPPNSLQLTETCFKIQKLLQSCLDPSPLQCLGIFFWQFCLHQKPNSRDADRK